MPRDAAILATVVLVFQISVAKTIYQRAFKHGPFLKPDCLQHICPVDYVLRKDVRGSCRRGSVDVRRCRCRCTVAAVDNDLEKNARRGDESRPDAR